MTKEAFLSGEKTVTRRLGWESLKPGTKVMAVEKAQGIKKGKQVKYLGPFVVLSVRRERLDAIYLENYGAQKEGHPLLGAEAFVKKFCEAMRCTPTTEVTRIEFRRCPNPVVRASAE